LKSLGKVHDLAYTIDSILRSGVFDEKKLLELLDAMKALIAAQSATLEKESGLLLTSGTRGDYDSVSEVFHRKRTTSRKLTARPKKVASTSKASSRKSTRTRKAVDKYEDNDGFLDQGSDDDGEDDEEDESHDGNSENSNDGLGGDDDSDDSLDDELEINLEYNYDDLGAGRQRSRRRAAASARKQTNKILEIESSSKIIASEDIRLGRLKKTAQNAMAVPTRPAATQLSQTELAEKMQIALPDKAMKSIGREAWNHISDADKHCIFAEGVTDEMAPGYSSEIEIPMDLSTMLTKINASDYRTLGDLDADMLRMFDNCIQYNGADSELGAEAGSLKKRWIDFRVKLVKRVDLSESEGTKESSDRILAGATSTTDDREMPVAVLEPLLKQGWSFMSKKDTRKEFAYEITDAIAPNYTKEIAKPMHLGKIHENISNKCYRNLKAFDDDMKLIFNNCIQYNGRNSMIGAVR
jgi:hypothetical protein